MGFKRSKVILPGFPEAVTPVIDTPDIAELLMYPVFHVADADTVWKHGSEFQRKLLSMCPLKHNRKHVTVYSSVHIVEPGSRPITTYRRKKGSEWHIDGIEGQSNRYDHWEPEETVYLFLSKSSKTTEFVTHEVEINDEKILSLNRYDFCSWMQNSPDAYGLIKDFAAIENDRIYEFSNNIHRAVMPDRIEFRFTYRVRETDRDDLPTVEQSMPFCNRFWDISIQDWNSNIYLREDGVFIKHHNQWLRKE